MRSAARDFVQIAVTAVLLLAVPLAHAGEVHVRDFGAFPDDNQDDIVAIRAAIAAVQSGDVRNIVYFDAGVYNLDENNAVNMRHIDLNDVRRLSLIGATDAEGEPATLLERNVPQMQNDLDTAYLLRIENCNSIVIQNIAFDNNPPFATAGIVVAVDEDEDAVEVEVFDGLPHFDGMKCYSANAWDLETRDLTHVTALTIGTDLSTFANTWQAVPGTQRYRIHGYGFSNRIHVGEGMSWHFYVLSAGGTSWISNTTNLTLDNVHFYNLKGVNSISNCTNLTLRNLEVKPIAPQLAVGARDAFHVRLNAGELLVEDCTIQGVRWDPFNIMSKLGEVTSIDGPRTLKCQIRIGSHNATVSGSLIFYAGDEPTVVDVAQSEKTGAADGVYYFTVELAENLPTSVEVGSRFTATSVAFDQATFRRCVFENNCGRPILYQNQNLLVEDCLFRNNVYAAIAMGPIDEVEGGFVNHAVIRNNVFADSTWDSTTGGDYNGALKFYQTAGFGDGAYNSDILVENNIFSGIKDVPTYSAIDIANAQDVTLRLNRFIDCTNEVRIDPDSTLNITRIDHAEVNADFNDMDLDGMREVDGQPAGTGLGFLADFWSANTVWVRVVEGDLSPPPATGYGVVSLGEPQCVQGLYTSADRRQARELVPVMGDNGAAIWISFLAQNHEPTDVAGIDFMASETTSIDPPSPVRKILLDGTTLRIESSGSGGGEADVAGKAPLGQTALVLAKLITGGVEDPEKIQVWVNPDVSNGAIGLPAPDFSQSGDLGWEMDGLTWLGLQSWDTGASGVGGLLDNLRISNGDHGFEFVVKPLVPGDCDRNQVFDLTDFMQIANCLAGPGMAAVNDCACADLDHDDDVDLADLGALQRQFAKGRK